MADNNVQTKLQNAYKSFTQGVQKLSDKVLPGGMQGGINRVSTAIKNDPGSLSVTRLRGNAVPTIQGLANVQIQNPIIQSIAQANNPINRILQLFPKNYQQQAASDLAYGVRGALNLTPFQSAAEPIQAIKNITGYDVTGKPGITQALEDKTVPQSQREQTAERVGRLIMGTTLAAGGGSPEAVLKGTLRRAGEGALMGTAFTTIGSIAQGRLPSVGELEEGAVKGIENSWKLAITDAVTDKVISSTFPTIYDKTGIKFFGGGRVLEDGSKAGFDLTQQGASGAFKELNQAILKGLSKEERSLLFKTGIKHLLQRAILETPGENFLFTAEDVLSGADKRSFIEAYIKNLPSTLVGNVMSVGMRVLAQAPAKQIAETGIDTLRLQKLGLQVTADDERTALQYMQSGIKSALTDFYTNLLIKNPKGQKGAIDFQAVVGAARDTANTMEGFDLQEAKNLLKPPVTGSSPENSVWNSRYNMAFQLLGQAQYNSDPRFIDLAYKVNDVDLKGIKSPLEAKQTIEAVFPEWAKTDPNAQMTLNSWTSIMAQVQAMDAYKESGVKFDGAVVQAIQKGEYDQAINLLRDKPLDHQKVMFDLLKSWGVNVPNITVNQGAEKILSKTAQKVLGTTLSPDEAQMLDRSGKMLKGFVDDGKSFIESGGEGVEYFKGSQNIPEEFKIATRTLGLKTTPEGLVIDGYSKPTPKQMEAIKQMFEGKEVISFNFKNELTGSPIIREFSSFEDFQKYINTGLSYDIKRANAQRGASNLPVLVAKGIRKVGEVMGLVDPQGISENQIIDNLVRIKEFQDLEAQSQANLIKMKERPGAFTPREEAELTARTSRLYGGIGGSQRGSIRLSDDLEPEDRMELQRLKGYLDQGIDFEAKEKGKGVSTPTKNFVKDMISRVLLSDPKEMSLTDATEKLANFSSAVDQWGETKTIDDGVIKEAIQTMGGVQPAIDMMKRVGGGSEEFQQAVPSIVTDYARKTGILSNLPKLPTLQDLPEDADSQAKATYATIKNMTENLSDINGKTVFLTNTPLEGVADEWSKTSGNENKINLLSEKQLDLGLMKDETIRRIRTSNEQLRLIDSDLATATPREIAQLRRARNVKAYELNGIVENLYGKNKVSDLTPIELDNLKDVLSKENIPNLKELVTEIKKIRLQSVKANKNVGPILPSNSPLEDLYGTNGKLQSIKDKIINLAELRAMYIDQPMSDPGKKGGVSGVAIRAGQALSRLEQPEQAGRLFGINESITDVLYREQEISYQLRETLQQSMGEVFGSLGKESKLRVLKELTGVEVENITPGEAMAVSYMREIFDNTLRLQNFVRGNRASPGPKSNPIPRRDDYLPFIINENLKEFLGLAGKLKLDVPRTSDNQRFLIGMFSQDPDYIAKIYSKSVSNMMLRDVYNMVSPDAVDVANNINPKAGQYVDDLVRNKIYGATSNDPLDKTLKELGNWINEESIRRIKQAVKIEPALQAELKNTHWYQENPEFAKAVDNGYMQLPRFRDMTVDDLNSMFVVSRLAWNVSFGIVNLSQPFNAVGFVGPKNFIKGVVKAASMVLPSNREGNELMTKLFSDNDETAFKQSGVYSDDGREAWRSPWINWVMDFTEAVNSPVVSFAGLSKFEELNTKYDLGLNSDQLTDMALEFNKDINTRNNRATQALLANSNWGKMLSVFQGYSLRMLTNAADAYELAWKEGSTREWTQRLARRGIGDPEVIKSLENIPDSEKSNVRNLILGAIAPYLWTMTIFRGLGAGQRAAHNIAMRALPGIPYFSDSHFLQSPVITIFNNATENFINFVKDPVKNKATFVNSMSKDVLPLLIDRLVDAYNMQVMGGIYTSFDRAKMRFPKLRPNDPFLIAIGGRGALEGTYLLRDLDATPLDKNQTQQIQKSKNPVKTWKSILTKRAYSWRNNQIAELGKNRDLSVDQKRAEKEAILQETNRRLGIIKSIGTPDLEQYLDEPTSSLLVKPVFAEEDQLAGQDKLMILFEYNPKTRKYEDVYGNPGPIQNPDSGEKAYLHEYTFNEDDGVYADENGVLAPTEMALGKKNTNKTLEQIVTIGQNKDAQRFSLKTSTGTSKAIKVPTFTPSSFTVKVPTYRAPKINTKIDSIYKPRKIQVTLPKVQAVSPKYKSAFKLPVK